jgi:hypothetical protein
VVATGGNQRQIDRPSKSQKQANPLRPAAAGCVPPKRERCGMISHQAAASAADADLVLARHFVTIAIVAFGAVVFAVRGIFGIRPKWQRKRHWSEAISGGRWSAAALTGIAVAVVAAHSGAWIPATLGFLFALPTSYATIAQIRRGRF